MSKFLALLTGNPWALLGAAMVLLSIGASGGWTAATWRASNQIAEIRADRDRLRLEHAEFMRATSETIVARLLENQQLRAERDRRGRAASQKYQEGIRDAENKFGPELAALRALWGAERLRPGAGEGSAGGGGLPAAVDPAGGPDAACDRRLSAVAEAAAGVAHAAAGVGESLHRASRQAKQLNELIEAATPK